MNKDIKDELFSILMLAVGIAPIIIVELGRLYQ